MTSDILPYMYIYTVYEIKVQHKLCIKEKNPQLCISQWPMFTSEWVHTVWSMTVNDREKKTYEMFLILAKEYCINFFKSLDTPASIFSYSIVVHSSTQPK